MDVYAYDDYRKCVQDWISNRPRGGYGEITKIAKALDTHPSIVTLLLKGEKHLTLEQASDFCDYAEFSELESEFFLSLTEWGRASKPGLKKRLTSRLKRLRERAAVLKERLPPEKELDEAARALFYSEWYYSGVRNLSAIDQYSSPEQIAERLALPRALVTRVIDFLLRYGLCVDVTGKIQIGPKATHLGADSILINRHHTNWRLKGLERMNKVAPDELFFTSPLSIAEKDIEAVRKILADCIERIFDVVEPSPSETVACINIDWFRF